MDNSQPIKSVFRATALISVMTLVGACGGESDVPRRVEREAAKLQAIAISPDEPSPLDTQFRLDDGEEIDVDALFSLLPEDFRPIFDTATFDDDLGATVLTHVRLPAAVFRGEGAVSYDLEFDGLRIDRLELYGVDAGSLEQVLSSDASVEAPMRRLLTKLRAYGVSGPALHDLSDDGRRGSNDDDLKTAIGALEIAGLSVRKGGFPPLSEDAEENGVGLARFLHAFAIDGFFFKDVQSTSVEETDDGVPLFETNLPDVRLVGLSGGKLDGFVLNDFSSITRRESAGGNDLQSVGGMLAPLAESITGPLSEAISSDESKFAIDRVEWRGIDFSRLLPFTLEGAVPPTDQRDLIELGQGSIKNATTFIDGKLFSSTPEVAFEEFGFTWLAPSKIRVNTEDVFYDFTVLFEEGSEEEALLKDLALNGVKGDGSVTYDWNPASGVATFDAVSAAPSFASSTVSFSLSNMVLDDLDEAEASVDGADALYADAALDGFKVELIDETALDALFGLIGIESGNGASARGGFTALLRIAGMQVGFAEPSYGTYVNRFADFLQNGGTFTIEAKPDAPVPLADLEALEGIDQLNALNLTVNHID
ncbi:MAG: hypothetical protein AAGH38_05685 [Pseudomonadota bacterium]